MQGLSTIEIGYGYRGRGRCEGGGRCGIGRRERGIEGTGKLRGSGCERLLIGGGTCGRLIHMRHPDVERGVNSP